jgi:hypothetical protein
MFCKKFQTKLDRFITNSERKEKIIFQFFDLARPFYKKLKKVKKVFQIFLTKLGRFIKK